MSQPAFAPSESRRPSSAPVFNQSHWRAVEAILGGLRAGRALMVLTGPEGSGAGAAAAEALSATGLVLVESEPEAATLAELAGPVFAAMGETFDDAVAGDGAAAAEALGPALRRMAAQDRGLAWLVAPAAPLTDQALAFITRLAALSEAMGADEADEPRDRLVGARILLCAPREALRDLAGVGDPLLREAASQPTALLTLFDAPSLSAAFRQRAGAALSAQAAAFAVAATGGAQPLVEALLRQPRLSRFALVGWEEEGAPAISVRRVAAAAAAIGLSAPAGVDLEALEEAEFAEARRAESAAAAPKPEPTPEPESALDAAFEAEAEAAEVDLVFESDELEDDAPAAERVAPIPVNLEALASAGRDRAAVEARAEAAAAQGDRDAAERDVEEEGEETLELEAGVAEPLDAEEDGAPAEEPSEAADKAADAEQVEAADDAGDEDAGDGEAEHDGDADQDDLEEEATQEREALQDPLLSAASPRAPEASRASGAALLTAEPDPAQSARRRRALLWTVGSVGAALASVLALSIALPLDEGAPSALDASEAATPQTAPQSAASQLAPSSGGDAAPSADFWQDSKLPAPRPRPAQRPVSTPQALETAEISDAAPTSVDALAMASRGSEGADDFPGMPPAERPAETRRAEAASAPAPGSVWTRIAGGALSAAEGAARAAPLGTALADELFEARGDLARGEAARRLASLTPEARAAALERLVDRALSEAGAHMRARRYAAPKGDSAYDALLSVYPLAPAEPRLRAALQGLVDYYEGQAKQALQEERYAAFHKHTRIADRIRARKPL